MYRSPYDIYFQAPKKIESLVLAHSQSGTRRRWVASTVLWSLTPQKELVSWPRCQPVEHGKSSGISHVVTFLQGRANLF